MEKQIDANDLIQILANNQTDNADPHPLRGPTYIRIEGGLETTPDAAFNNAKLYSSRTRDFSTEKIEEKAFSTTDRVALIYGVVGLWYRVETTTAGIIAFRAPIRTSREGAFF